MSVKQELEKIRQMPPKSRLAYIWTYYRFLLAILAFAIILACEIITTVQASKAQPILSIAVINGNRSDENKIKNLETTFLTALKANSKNKKVKIDVSTMTGDQSAQQIKTTLTISYLGENDIVICDKDTYEKYKKQGAFVSWKSILGKDIYNYQQYIDEEALDLSKSQVWLQTDLTDYTPVYCCVLKGNKHKKQTKNLIKYLYP